MHVLRYVLPAVIAAAVFVSDAQAIPAFARKYNVTCFTCHTGDYKLNAFGAAVDANGHQLPGTVEHTPIWNQNALPLSILLQQRVSSTWTQYDRGATADSSSGTVNSAVMSIVGGGVLAPHVSLMSELDFELNGQELIASLEYAFVNFSNLANSDEARLNVRFGKTRMETLFEQTPEFYMSKYLIYEYPLLISARPQQYYLSFPWYGVGGSAQFTAVPLAPTLTMAYSVGDVGDITFAASHLWYGRLSSDFAVGPVPVTIGVSGIYGEQQLDPILKDSLYNIGRHIGLDWQIAQPNGGPISMYGQVMKFYQTDVIKAAGNQPENAFGGFVELNGVVVPEKLTCQLRYDFVNRETVQPRAQPTDPESQKNINTAQYTLIARYHLMPNFHLFVEGNIQNTETSTTGGPTANAPAVTRSAVFVSGGIFLGL